MGESVKEDEDEDDEDEKWEGEYGEQNETNNSNTWKLGWKLSALYAYCLLVNLL